MVSAGQEALWQCWRTYDETRGTSFWSYAYHRVKGSMVDTQRARDHAPKSGRKRISQETQVPWALTSQVDDHLALARVRADDNPEDRLLEADFALQLMELINRLPEPLRSVIRDHHRRPLGELATRLGVTQSRISQLYKEAVTTVRKLFAYCDVCKTTFLESASHCPACGGALWPAEPGDFPQISQRRSRRTKTRSP